MDCVSGGEFLVILPSISQEQARKAGNEICKRFAAMVDSILAKSHLSVSLSGGTSEFPSNAENRTELFRGAREAAYRASKAGGNRVFPTEKGPMRATSTQYTSVQIEKLKQLSSMEGISQVSLLREALDDLLLKYGL